MNDRLVVLVPVISSRNSPGPQGLLLDWRRRWTVTVTGSVEAGAGTLACIMYCVLKRPKGPNQQRVA